MVTGPTDCITTLCILTWINYRTVINSHAEETPAPKSLLFNHSCWWFEALPPLLLVTTVGRHEGIGVEFGAEPASDRIPCWVLNNPDSNHSRLSCTRWDEWGSRRRSGEFVRQEGYLPYILSHLLDKSHTPPCLGFWSFLLLACSLANCFYAAILRELLPKAHSWINLFLQQIPYLQVFAFNSAKGTHLKVQQKEKRTTSKQTRFSSLISLWRMVSICRGIPLFALLAFFTRGLFKVKCSWFQCDKTNKTVPDLIKLFYGLNLLNESVFSTLLSSKEHLACHEWAVEFLAISDELSKLDIRSKKRSVVQSNATWLPLFLDSVLFAAIWASKCRVLQQLFETVPMNGSNFLHLMFLKGHKDISFETCKK